MSEAFQKAIIRHQAVVSKGLCVTVNVLTSAAGEGVRNSSSEGSPGSSVLEGRRPARKHSSGKPDTSTDSQRALQNRALSPLSVLGLAGARARGSASDVQSRRTGCESLLSRGFPLWADKPFEVKKNLKKLAAFPGMEMSHGRARLFWAYLIWK